MKRNTFVRAVLVRNRSPKGNPSFRPLRNYLSYLQQGSRLDQTQNGEVRGIWYGNNERSTLTQYGYEEVHAWAKAHSQQQMYTYQLLLSTRDGQLAPDNFHQTLLVANRSWDIGSWRFIVHQDTAHQHAHALFFRDQRLPKTLFLQGQEAMHESLAQAVKRQQQEAEIEATRQRQAQEQHAQQAQMAERSRQLSRSRGLDL